MNISISKSQVYLFNMAIIWSLITTLFTWLPVVRIIGKPNEYYWGVFGMAGEGTNGPFWIFIIGSCYAVLLFYSAFRVETRRYAYFLILIWNAFVLYLIMYGVLSSIENTIQGQGLHWEFSIWFLLIPATLFTVISVVWIIKESQNGMHFKVTAWNFQNSIRLMVSLALLLLAIFLFRTGDNYNWITSAAIIVTIVQWVMLIESIKPKVKKK